MTYRIIGVRIIETTIMIIMFKEKYMNMQDGSVTLKLSEAVANKLKVEMDDKVVCEVCGQANEKGALMCTMCSNYLEKGEKTNG